MTPIGLLSSCDSPATSVSIAALFSASTSCACVSRTRRRLSASASLRARQIGGALRHLLLEVGGERLELTIEQHVLDEGLDARGDQLDERQVGFGDPAAREATSSTSSLRTTMSASGRARLASQRHDQLDGGALRGAPRRRAGAKYVVDGIEQRGDAAAARRRPLGRATAVASTIGSSNAAARPATIGRLAAGLGHHRREPRAGRLGVATSASGLIDVEHVDERLQRQLEDDVGVAGATGVRRQRGRAPRAGASCSSITRCAP